MDLDDVAHRLATALHEAVGAEEAVLRVRVSGGALVLDAWAPARHRVDCGAAGMRALYDARPGTYEVRLRADGSYTFEAGGALWPVADGWLLFDEDFRYPGHPLPGMPRPAAAAPTGAPTNPAVLAELTALCEEFAGHYTRIKGQAPPWPAGRTEAEISAVEERIGARLPEDLRALYLVADGDPEETGLLGPYSANPLDQVVGDHTGGPPGAYGWEDSVSDTGVVFEPPPFGLVKRLSRNDWWIPFGSDRALNFLCADLDPAPGGRAGQVLEYGRDVEGLRYVAPSVTAMIREVVEALRAGKHKKGGGSAFLRTEVALRDNKFRSHSGVVTGSASAVHEIADRQLMQHLCLNDAGTVNLGVIEDFPALRELEVNRATRIIGGLDHLPAIEALRVRAGEVDLRAFAGHSLWSLELAGLTRPVAVQELAALPNLTRLAVAEAEVLELERIAELPNLRVLSLSRAQVGHLLAAGAPFPRLAALQVPRRTPVAAAAGLWSRFSPEREAPWYTELTGAV
ncbi:SMI1/KNR4 family protein [Amycolatopsis sp. NPDC051372]|uniref:SMI1/KNR4 family protein n=1 Tax=unclassified Amycolatopsis TaxID=2618356 RepID=UPI003427B7DC